MVLCCLPHGSTLMTGLFSCAHPCAPRFLMKAVLQLPLKGSNHEQAFRVLSPWLGLTFWMNLAVIVGLELSYATTPYMLDAWYVWMPLVWSVLVYLLFLATGNAKLKDWPAAAADAAPADTPPPQPNVFDVARAKKYRVLFAGLLFAYIVGFVGFWGVLMIIRAHLPASACPSRVP